MSKLIIIAAVFSLLFPAIIVAQPFAPPPDPGPPSLPSIYTPGTPGPLPPDPVLIPTVVDPSDLTDIYRRLGGQWISNTASFGLAVFRALALLGFMWFLFTLWRDRHTLDSGLFATLNKMLAIAAFYALLLNGLDWMPQVIDLFVNYGKQASGVQSLAPSSILKLGINIASKLFWSGARAGLHLDFSTAIALNIGAFWVVVAFLVITLQFIVALLDVIFGVAIGTLFLAFGACQWTVAYVERYFAFCVASGVKLMAMYLLVGVGMANAAGWETLAAQIGGTAGAIMTAWLIACGGLIFAFICWHCSRFMTAILGGAPSMAASDAVAFLVPFASLAIMAASAAATGVTAGAATPAAAGVAAAGTGGRAAGSGVGGATPPAAPPPGSGGGHAATAVAAAMNASRAALSFARAMPSATAHISPPHHNGFGH